MATAQEEIFYTDDMALAAYLLLCGHEVEDMLSRPIPGKTDGRGRAWQQVYWGFDRNGDKLQLHLAEVQRGAVTINLYKFMGALNDARDLMNEYKQNPSAFE